jgi:hypothetical protein
VTASQVVDSNNDFHLPPVNVGTRSCGLCRNKGHGRQNCPLVTKYGAVPLENNNVQIRKRLSRNLSVLSKYEETTDQSMMNNPFHRAPCIEGGKGIGDPSSIPD